MKVRNYLGRSALGSYGAVANGTPSQGMHRYQRIGRTACVSDIDTAMSLYNGKNEYMETL